MMSGTSPESIAADPLAVASKELAVVARPTYVSCTAPLLVEYFSHIGITGDVDVAIATRQHALCAGNDPWPALHAAARSSQVSLLNLEKAIYAALERRLPAYVVSSRVRPSPSGTGSDL